MNSLQIMTCFWDVFYGTDVAKLCAQFNGIAKVNVVRETFAIKF